ncbi:MAG: hypothetical protein QF460_02935, partial [Candidatus Nanoarchaeia archaeon]|nr:hypothetical protein [Candidatus Nanoarchaeia archaeon]
MNIKKNLAIFEIFLLVIMSFSIAYLISETNDNYSGIKTESNFIKKSRALALSWLSKGLVSAQEVYYTCYENLNGTLCQTYPADTCDDFCLNACVPSDNIYSCELGTCYDDVVGSCQPAVPRAACFDAFDDCNNDNDGCWFENPPAQCNRGCCIINPYEADGETYGSDALFMTGQECNYFVSQGGYENFEFHSEIDNELECIFRTGAGNQGACVLEYIPAEGASDCKFTTFSECNSLGGDFSEGTLCTNSA